MSATAIVSGIQFLHPLVMPAFIALEGRLAAGFARGETKTQFLRFETFRSPERQEYLFRKKSTKARAWQSAHNYGMGADYVPYTDKGWSWDENHDYPYLKATAEKCGLAVPLLWDSVHVQAPAFAKVTAVLSSLLAEDPDQPDMLA